MTAMELIQTEKAQRVLNSKKLESEKKIMYEKFSLFKISLSDKIISLFRRSMITDCQNIKMNNNEGAINPNSNKYVMYVNIDKTRLYKSDIELITYLYKHRKTTAYSDVYYNFCRKLKHETKDILKYEDKFKNMHLIDVSFEYESDYFLTTNGGIVIILSLKEKNKFKNSKFYKLFF